MNAAEFGRAVGDRLRYEPHRQDLAPEMTVLAEFAAAVAWADFDAEGRPSITPETFAQRALDKAERAARLPTYPAPWLWSASSAAAQTIRDAIAAEFTELFEEIGT